MPQERVYDKINYQTNFTAPSTFAILLNAIKAHGTVKSDEARATIFPQARAAVMNYDASNRDTHGEITLKQYGLIDYVSEKEFKLSFLGERYLELFYKNDENKFVPKANNEYNYNSVMIDSLLSWRDDAGNKIVHPGFLLLKLLSDKAVEEYVTAYDWAFVCEHSTFKDDADYKKLVKDLLEFRKNSPNIELKKTDVFLGGFAGKWNIFNKSANGRYTLNESTKRNLSQKLKEYDLFDKKSDGIFAEEKPEPENDNTPNSKAKGGYNKIYYGAPGCGKSFIVNDTLNKANVSESNRIRVTFHPEYANCDFVGQILPTIEKKINNITGEEEDVVKYVFNPGPFTLALKRARETNEMVYLIIEEINRGNAAAIFGDLFQLLDRQKDPTKSNFGESEYPICNVNVQKYLNLSETDKLVIPSNLTIYATMNTSDQNVFTLDTAFKRRWSSEQVSNDIVKDETHKYKNFYVPGTNVTLERFLTVINLEILKHKITSEDKRMGKYFITKDCLTEEICEIETVRNEAEMFAYKVLEYIWNDVCKIGKDEWFDTSIFMTLEDLIDAFVNPQNGETPLSVFKSITF